MKEFSVKLHHPDHGELTAHGNMGLKGVHITHYGHKGETVPAPDAHGPHEGGVSDHMQGQIKAHVHSLGPGMHHENDKVKALKLHKSDEPPAQAPKMDECMKSEHTPRETAVALLNKVKEMAEDTLKKVEAKEYPLTNKGRNPADDGIVRPVKDQSLDDAAGSQKIDEPKVTGNANDAADEGELEEMKRNGKYNKLKKFMDKKKAKNA